MTAATTAVKPTWDGCYHGCYVRLCLLSQQGVATNWYHQNHLSLNQLGTSFSDHLSTASCHFTSWFAHLLYKYVHICSYIQIYIILYQLDRSIRSGLDAKYCHIAPAVASQHQLLSVSTSCCLTAPVNDSKQQLLPFNTSCCQSAPAVATEHQLRTHLLEGVLPPHRISPYVTTLQTIASSGQCARLCHTFEKPPGFICITILWSPEVVRWYESCSLINSHTNHNLFKL